MERFPDCHGRGWQSPRKRRRMAVEEEGTRIGVRESKWYFPPTVTLPAPVVAALRSLQWLVELAVAVASIAPNVWLGGHVYNKRFLINCRGSRCFGTAFPAATGETGRACLCQPIETPNPDDFNAVISIA